MPADTPQPDAAAQLIESAHSVFAELRDAKSAERTRLWVELREATVAALAKAERRGEEKERARCAQACLNEYGRWKDADNDSRGIALGALGAASNILCAIERIPSVADEPMNENESRTADALTEGETN